LEKKLEEENSKRDEDKERKEKLNKKYEKAQKKYHKYENNDLARGDSLEREEEENKELTGFDALHVKGAKNKRHKKPVVDEKGMTLKKATLITNYDIETETLKNRKTKVNKELFEFEKKA